MAVHVARMYEWEFIQNCRKSDHLENLCVYRKTILKSILSNWRG